MPTGAFALDRIAPVEWSEEPFDRLVLDAGKKHLVRALVTEHACSAGVDDIVAGKGRGLVGLLCGPPGCGKTLTAEAVAEIARRRTGRSLTSLLLLLFFLTVRCLFLDWAPGRSCSAGLDSIRYGREGEMN